MQCNQTCAPSPSDSLTNGLPRNRTVIFPAITTMTNTWSQTVILLAITTNLSPHRTGVVIMRIIINTIDSWCDRHELGPYPRARLSIDLIHSAEVSTLYPHYGTHGLALPFGWTNGVPTKPIYCHDTLPATLTHSQLG